MSLEIPKPKRPQSSESYAEAWNRRDDLEREWRGVAHRFGVDWEVDNKRRKKRGEPGLPRERMTLRVRCNRAMHLVTVVARGPAILHNHPGNEVKTLRTMAAIRDEGFQPYGCLAVLEELKHSCVRHSELRWFLFMKEGARGTRRGRAKTYQPMLTERYRNMKLKAEDRFMHDAFEWSEQQGLKGRWYEFTSVCRSGGPDIRLGEFAGPALTYSLGREVWRRCGFPAVMDDALFVGSQGRDRVAMLRKGHDGSAVLWWARLTSKRLHWDWPTGQLFGPPREPKKEDAK